MALYSPRVQVYAFGSVTAGTTGGINTVTRGPIVGEVIKLVIDDINTASTGSIFVQYNPPNSNAYFTIGSVIDTASNQEVYFSVNQQGTGGDTGAYPIVADPLTLSGAGFGNGSSVVAWLYYK